MQHSCRGNLIIVLAAFLMVPAFALPSRAEQARELNTRHVVLVTIDGVRTEEVFGGLDETIVNADKKLSGIQNVGALRTRFMRPTPKERRQELMPFIWGTIAEKGVILGDPAIGSSVRVTNRFKVSYPGYAEILTGADQPKVASNLPFRMPRKTVLEYLKAEKGWAFHEIATFASWQTFNLITQREKGSFFCNAGYAAVLSPWLTPEMEPLNTLQFQMLTPWDTVRFDRVTWGLAVGYLKHHRPRVLYLALGEPDDWGHNRRYDRVLHSIREADEAIRKVWEAIQSTDGYRDATTLIITTDHGRGRTPESWIDHDRETPGSDAIWIAMMGPDTPALGSTGAGSEFTAGQVATTLARLFHAEYRDFYAQAAPSLELMFESK